MHTTDTGVSGYASHYPPSSLFDKFTPAFPTACSPHGKLLTEKAVAQYAATTLEAKVLSAIDDTSLTAAARKKKLSAYSDLMGTYTSQYKVDMKTLMLQDLVREALNKVMTTH